MFKLYLFFQLAIGSLAGAAVIPHVTEIRDYCISKKKGEVADDLAHDVILHLLRAKLYTTKMGTGTSRACGDGIYIKATARAAAYLRKQGYGVRLAPSFSQKWQSPEQKLKEKALTEANKILTDFALAALASRDEKALLAFKNQYWAQFLVWEIKEVREGERVWTYRQLLYEHSLATGLRREFDDIYGSRRQFLNLEATSFEDKVRASGIRLGPVAGMSLRMLDSGKQALPHLRGVFEENEDKATFMMSLTPEGQRLTKEIKTAEDLLLISLARLHAFDEYNVQTFEVFAITLIAELNYLDAHVEDFVIADTINRFISLWRWFERRGRHVRNGEARFGNKFVLALQKMASYPGLDPYPRLLLHALLANQIRGQSEPPSAEDIFSYNELWANMPIGPVYGLPSIGIPMQPYGPLTFSHGSKWTTVFEGLGYIDRWFIKHGLETENWYGRSGPSLDAVLEMLTQRRADHLEARGFKLCENLLSSLGKSDESE